MRLIASCIFVVLAALGSTPAARAVNITQQPVSTNVLLGANAFFAVGTSGGTPISYWWQFNGTNLVNNAHIGGANTRVLRITNVFAGDVGNYRVIVSNNANVKTSSVVTLTVLFPPVITIQPVSQSAWDGTSPTFTVGATGTLPLRYQWSFNGTNLLGATNAALVLTNVQPSKTGIYSVRVTNSFGIMQSSNATLIVNTVVPGVPFISGFAPLSTNVGATVTIQGTNFSPVLSNNIVLFGAVRAIVTSASATNLAVTVPLGATYAPITVTVNGFTGYGNVPFQPAFIGDGSNISPATFAPRQNLPANAGPIRTVIGDLDGDGKPDLAIAHVFDHMISMFRNIGTNGALSINSFAPRVDFPVVVSGSDSPYDLIAADVDGDGKLDLVFLDKYVNRLGIYRNIAVPGTLTTDSFEAPVFFTVGTAPRGLVARDLDGDGRTDLVAVNYGDGSISILRNNGSPGSLNADSFAPKLDFALGMGIYSVAVQDLDGDGKPDIAVAGDSSNVLWVLRNLGVAGALGTNSFAPGINLPTLGQQAAIVVGDLDADGRPELIAGGNSMSMSVNRNLADPGSLSPASFASFLNFSAPGWIHDLALGDLNGDGKTDIILDGELNSYLAVFQNLGAPGGFGGGSLGGRVDFATGWNAWGVSVGDLDGDSRPDAVLGNAYEGTISLYQNLTSFGGQPNILSQPTNTVAVANNTARFTVFATGKSMLNCQWLLNGTNLADNAHISGATTATLVISNVQTNDAGNYKLIITNSLGSATSEIATLTVLFPPDITIQPANPVAFLGSNITLIAAGAGASPMSYQWRKNETNLTDGGNISGATTMALTLTNAQFGDAGAYSVVVTNIFGSVTSSVPLRVTVPAGTWVKWDASQGGNGHSYNGVVNTSGLNWLQADQIARNEGGYLATITSAAENNFVFNVVNDPQFFSGVGGNGSGPALGGVRTNSTSPAGADWTWETGEPWSYTTWAAGQPDSLGETRLEFWSGVQGSPSPNWNNLSPTDSNLGGYVIEREDFPSIVFQPTDATVAVGTNASFTVVALGSPTLTYQWVANGTNIVGATNAALTLMNVQFAQSGYYFVTVSNAFGTVVSSNAMLTVMTPPAFIQSPTNLTVTAGGTATFNALVTGDPPLSYQWQFNGSPLSDSVRVIGSATDTLTISNAQNSDAGNYIIVVTNLVGSITSSPAALTVITPPSITKQPLGCSVPVGLLASFTATATGTAPLRYQWQLNGADVPGATNFSLAISNTVPNDFGAYQLVVTNFGGAVTSSVAMLTIGPVATWGTFSFAANVRPFLAPPGLTNVIAVGAGSGYSLLLKTDGSLVAWGSTAATNVPTLNDAVAIAAGSTHALALRANGTVVAWGVNTSGQTNVPAGLSNVVAIAAGTTHSVALRNDGTVVSWGLDPRFKTLTPPPTLTKVTAIDGGGSQTLALLENKTVTGWDGNGLLALPAGLNNVADISAGPSFSAFNIVLFTNGTVAAWAAFGPATNVPAGLAGVVDIETGGDADQSTGIGMALRTNGLIRAWGSSNVGLTNVPSGLSNVVAMAGGSSHCLALVNDGRPLILRPPVGGTAFTGRDFKLKSTVAGNAALKYRWQHDGVDVPGGTNDVLILPNTQTNDAGMYQLIVSNSLGVATSLAVPVTVMDSAPFFLLQPAQTNRVFLGSRFTLPTSVGGSGPMHFQWRFNNTNIPGATNDALLLARTRMTNAGNYILVASNSFGAVTSVVAKVTVSQVVAWGDNTYNQANVPPSLTNVVAIAANANAQFTLALRADGTVTGWGVNFSNQTNVPADITNVVEIALSSNYGLALKSDGTVRAWGTGVNASFSNALTNLYSIIAIEADFYGATFLRTNGTVTRFNTGGGIINLLPPPTNAVALAPFDDGVAILRADGTVFTMGSGFAPPVTTNVLGLGFARYHGLLLKRDSSLVGWGTPTLPTNILVNISNMVDVAANGLAKFAVRSDGTVAAWGTGFNNNNTNVPAGLTNVGVLDAGVNHAVALLFARDLPTVFLPDALDTPGLVVSSKASPQWFGQSNITHDGSDAAQSAEIGNGTASSMRMFVTGPITASFWWKVSSQTNQDLLKFSAKGVLLTNISGEVGWQQASIDLPAGPQLLQWTYAKDGSGSSGQDAAWVDQITITPTPPSILVQPLDKDVLGGSNVTFSVTAYGTPPLMYQWKKNGGTVQLSPSATYSLFNVTRANSGTYSVIVTNLGGSVTSSNAVLTVHVPQNLGAPVLQPDGTFLLTSADADGGALTASDLANLQVQVTTNLLDWTTLPDALILTNGAIQLQDTGAVDQPMRFYRIIETW